MRHGSFYFTPMKSGVFSFSLYINQMNMNTIKTWAFYACICLCLSSCEFNCSIGKKDDEANKSKTISSSTTEKDGAILTNNIELSAKGVKVTKATLLLPDGSRVSDDNVVNLNEKIQLVVSTGDGWNLKNGKVFVGASEKITTDGGTAVVNAEDLFKDYSNTGFDPKDAKLITLSAVITDELTSIKYYTVTFRIWDKNGDAEITGEYKFYIKH